jgi:hypothetical protein
MKTPKYPTLAAVRNADPEKFDAFIRDAVFAAAADVGFDVVVRALCGPARRPQ